MKLKNFKEFEIWQESKKIAIAIYKITLSNSLKKDYNFIDQIRRSSLSIPSNIAEGFERDTKNEFIRYLRIAKGSCGELLTQLEIAYEIDYISKAELDRLNGQCITLSARIGKLIHYLQTSKLAN